jgi:hypothetical protein
MICRACQHALACMYISRTLALGDLKVVEFDTSRDESRLSPKISAGRVCLQIAESRRDGDQVRQQVIAMQGHFEDLRARRQLERLLRSDAGFAAKAMMLSAAADDAAIKIAVHRIGPALVSSGCGRRPVAAP